MSWREDLKVGLLRADQLFIGTANGGLGTDATAAILALLGGGGGALVTDIEGNVLAADGVSVIIDAGADGTDAIAQLSQILDGSGLEIFGAANGFQGSVTLSLDIAAEYVSNSGIFTTLSLGDANGTTPIALLTKGLASMFPFSDDSDAVIGLTGIKTVSWASEDASVPGAAIPFGGLMAIGDSVVLTYMNVLDVWAFSLGLTGNLLAADQVAVVLDPGTDGTDADFMGDIQAEDGQIIILSAVDLESSYVRSAHLAINIDPIIDSVATPGDSPATIEDTRVSFGHLQGVVGAGTAGVFNGVDSIIPIASAATITGFTPQYIGQRVTIFCADSTGDAVVVCGAGVTFDGTNDTATFAVDGDAIEVVAVSLLRWLVISNTGAVAFT
jgi:hypothetical protein